MGDAVAFHDQLMDWVYDKANGTSTENVPIMEFAESVGLDLDGAYTLLWYCRDEGLLSDKGSGMGNPCGILTAYGIADVRERRRRRADGRVLQSGRNAPRGHKGSDPLQNRREVARG